ncbi:Gfo/Idh/MocA family oxidoreductase [Brevibacillus brevis]|uniref:Gfo/Idh/MocA family oxidoreductase n=1 Tax=Brevibacillus brevis TaxID=1393 RepID=A0ABY9T4J1_BREBE|nr:Gfo/Idh/MocA family oxidoreductase [Brevibacillus brevis]WNC14794.1 Gfo/Idh/MocA family oxidoreductase [Brevibacillus brevis]
MRKVNWGIMSAARIAVDQLIPAMQREGHSEIKAIASKSEKGRKVAEQFGIPAVYDDYEELLRDPEVEAVYIPLPNGLHKEWSIKAAQHSKHVLCEKPSGLTSEETREILQVFQKYNVVFMEGFMYRHHPQHERVKQIIESGEIGEVKLFRAALNFFLEDTEGDIRMNRELGGGSLYDVGCYCIHSARMILGDEPISVYATGKVDKRHQVDTMVTALLEMKKGVRVMFDCSFETVFRNEYEVVGTKGTIRVPRAYRPDLQGGEGLVIVTLEDGPTREEKIAADQYALEVAEMNEMIVHGKTAGYTAEQMIGNMRVIDACYQSLRSGATVAL